MLPWEFWLFVVENLRYAHLERDTNATTCSSKLVLSSFVEC